MTENLWIAAQISLLGMGLVFGAIFLLWGVLALLVRLTTERPAAPEAVVESTRPTDISAPLKDKKAMLARAAAAAVAVALAQKRDPTQGDTTAMPPSSTVSAWQAVMRATHLNARRPRRG